MRPRVVVALTAWLILLFVIGGYAVSLTFVEGLDLRAIRTLDERLFDPATKLVDSLQRERQLSVQLIGGGGRDRRDALDEQRTKTDAAEQAFRRAAGAEAVRDAAEGRVGTRVDAVLSRLDGIKDGRAAIDAGRSSRTDAAARFSRMIDAFFPLYSELPANDLPQVSDQHRSLVELQRAREVLAREVALLAGALANGGITEAEHEEFGRLVGTRRFLFGELETSLTGRQLDEYREVIGNTAFGEIREVEEEVGRSGGDGSHSPPVTPRQWSTYGGAALGEMAALGSRFDHQMLQRSDSAADATLLQAALTVLVGLVLVAVLMTVWLRVAPRHVIGQLDGLKAAALSLANERLPRVVSKLQRGEHVDVHAEAPPLEFGADEFGDVGRAFNAVQRTAVQAAVDQAALRNGIKDVFVNLARRSQGLVHRQLTMLDEMERRATDPDELARLFAIDHLATRMRRHAEDLIILSGSPPGRRWRKPVPLIDVVRAAVGEVESYTRVTVLPIPQGALTGHVVADAIHLLAELVENATAFSPPHTKVQINGQLVPAGFVVEIEDRGLGMSDADMATYNDRLAHPPEFNLSDTVRLGLFVVGRLAERHDVKVHLRRSPYGGTTAIVLFPATLVVTTEALEAGPEAEERPSIEPGPRLRRPMPGPVPANNRSRTVDATPAVRTVEAAPADQRSTGQAAAPAGSAGQSADRDASEDEKLPRRVRQASLATELRDTPVRSGPRPAPRERPPEQIRSMMAAFQRGSVLGRSEAERLDEPNRSDVNTTDDGRK